MAPRHEMYAAYLDWQRRRLGKVGVDVALGHRASAEDAESFGADTVAVATGATPRVPPILGAADAGVVDVRDVLAGRAAVGSRVLVVAQDDHVAPLSVADRLSGDGHEVVVTYATAGPAPLLGRYIIGGILGRLDAQGVRMRFMEEVVAIRGAEVEVRNVYSLRKETVGPFDSVVLACGSVSDSSLYDALKPRLSAVHVLGDAYAPRRLVFATKQAYALADLLTRT
jgi:pyruvate/2-oxoglutarate dehydrogenase complex dihydrolipoamide dehydrogenase (E3) component